MVAPEVAPAVEAEDTTKIEAKGGGSGEGHAAWPAIVALVTSRMPALRASYDLEPDAAACARDVAAALDQIRAALRSFDGRKSLPDWVVGQARLAVEERLVEVLRSGTAGAARAYCRKRLAEAVRERHHAYFLGDVRALRERHIRDAERILDERLADYDGSIPFHRYIRQVARHEGIERRGMHGLDDWLQGHGRQAVERYVVEQMLADPDSHLAMVCLCWVAQRVCQWYKVTPGDIADPRAGYEVVWERLLESVPDHLRERIQDHSSTINTRILRGLRTFQFQSSFDTWRTAIILNTMSSISKVERREQKERPLYDRLQHDDDEGPEQPLAIADGRQDLAPHADLIDARAIMEEVLRVVFGGSGQVRAIVEWRIDGVEAKEIEERSGVAASKVHHIFSRFRWEVRRRYQERIKDQPGGDPDEC